MNVREKLVKLLDRFVYDDWYSNDEIAEELISNGVTVQEWISVKKHLPQENEPEDTVCELVQVLLV